MIDTSQLIEPTPEECSADAHITRIINGVEVKGVATWYPQMGGYVGKAFITTDGLDSCFDCYVWHDGEFPFHDGRNPVRLHHCATEQFRDFADVVESFQEAQAFADPTLSDS